MRGGFCNEITLFEGYLIAENKRMQGVEDNEAFVPNPPPPEGRGGERLGCRGGRGKKGKFFEGKFKQVTVLKILTENFGFLAASHGSVSKT